MVARKTGRVGRNQGAGKKTVEPSKTKVAEAPEKKGDESSSK